MENRRREHEAERRRAKEEAERGTIELSDQYKQKLIVEYQRFESLDEQHRALKRGYSKKLESMERQKEAEVCVCVCEREREIADEAVKK